MLQTKQKNDKIETLDYAERWMRDGLTVVKQGDFFQSIEVDMSQVNRVLQKINKKGIKASYPNVIVRATTIVLSQNPALHQLITPTKRRWSRRNVLMTIKTEAVNGVFIGWCTGRQ